MENYYELLEVSQNASDEVISKVFKHHIKKNHPDLYKGQEKKEAEIRVKKLNEAYEILSNPDKRKEYDNELKNYENEKNNIKELEIDQLKNRNEKLNHTIQNYNRFIYEYFYENADEVFEVINSYDKEQELNNNYNKKIKNKFKFYIFKFVIYLIVILFLFILISVIFKINMFSIFFNTFFK